MTVQELKKEANKHGYKLVRQKIPIPTDYKRNYKQILINIVLMFATCLGAIALLCFFLLM